MSRKTVKCPRCGEVKLSQEEYNRQMQHADSLWYCPTCGATARFGFEYFECVVGGCNGEVREDSDTCPDCGTDQYEYMAQRHTCRVCGGTYNSIEVDTCPYCPPVREEE